MEKVVTFSLFCLKWWSILQKVFQPNNQNCSDKNTSKKFINKCWKKSRFKNMQCKKWIIEKYQSKSKSKNLPLLFRNLRLFSIFNSAEQYCSIWHPKNARKNTTCKSQCNLHHSIWSLNINDTKLQLWCNIFTNFLLVFNSNCDIIHVVF